MTEETVPIPSSYIDPVAYLSPAFDAHSACWSLPEAARTTHCLTSDMNLNNATDRLSGLAAVLAGVWVLGHFGYGFWSYVLASLLWFPGTVALLAAEPVSHVVNRIIAPLDSSAALSDYFNVLLKPVQNIAGKIDGLHRKAAFKVFALVLGIGLCVLTLALLLLALLVTAVGASQGRSRRSAGPASIIGSQKEVIDIQVQYENSYVWEPRTSCANYDQEIALELQRILERPSVWRARAIGRDSRRVYDSLQK